MYWKSEMSKIHLCNNYKIGYVYTHQKKLFRTFLPRKRRDRIILVVAIVVVEVYESLGYKMCGWVGGMIRERFNSPPLSLILHLVDSCPLC